jgi:hypothetical protein
VYNCYISDEMNKIEDDEAGNGGSEYETDDGKREDNEVET